MNFIHSEIVRLLLFILVTLAQILLAIFLLFYGNESLKPFATFILIIQLFAIRKIYFYLSHMFRYSRT